TRRHPGRGPPRCTTCCAAAWPTSRWAAQASRPVWRPGWWARRPRMRPAPRPGKARGTWCEEATTAATAPMARLRPVLGSARSVHDWSGAALQSQLLHPGLERRSLEAQDAGGAAGAADAPAGLFEHGGDVLALDLRRCHEVAQHEAAGRRQDEGP